MGWGDCGTDSEGRNIGYVWPAICDHPNCEVEIDRGLGYACGDMHGESEWYCEKYFCGEHQRNWMEPEGWYHGFTVCDECAVLTDDDGRPVSELGLVLA